jgi:hypothetical protein
MVELDQVKYEAGGAMMRRSWLMVPAVMAVIATGCSGEDLAEKVIEDRLEAESGEDVDIDFDDGNIRVQTDDGELSIDVDEDGDGSVSVSGSGEEGDFSIQSEDGETVIESDEGSAVLSSSGDLPDGFPDGVPIPDGLTIQLSQAIESADGTMFSVTGEMPGAPADVTADYVASLEDAGFAQTQLTTTPDGGFFVYDDGEFDVAGSVGAGSDDGMSFINIAVSPTQQG